ncbi:MAG: hypothetical protein PUG50_06440 [Eubacteriales bacterium]|uniref:hypothetical protein n=1 Tax=Fenollaria sp. TaxID=1965292 RepID=UPI002A74D5EB|nr:hypothetical protein [Fenollaria sp.]MDD7340204.1 hypothetical protein [Eubacteriales bacterium]MDY3105515.1 hypothetical protein [Fenollaria sp.]
MFKNTLRALLSYILITVISVLMMLSLKKLDNPLVLRIVMIIYSLVILMLFYLSGFLVNTRYRKNKALKSYNLIIFIGLIIFIASLILSKFYIKAELFTEKYFIFNIMNQAMYLVLKSFFIPVNAITSFIAFLMTKLLYSLGVHSKYKLRK